MRGLAIVALAVLGLLSGGLAFCLGLTARQADKVAFAAYFAALALLAAA